MARKIWPQGKYKFVVVLSLGKLFILVLVFGTFAYTNNDESEVGKYEPDAGGSDVIDSESEIRDFLFNRPKRETNHSVDDHVFQNDSYLLNYSNSSFHKRRKKGKKRKKGEKFRNGTRIRRKKKKKDSVPGGIPDGQLPVIQLPLLNESLNNFSATPKPRRFIEKSTIIRTSEDDDPRNRLLIETVRTDSKPEVRYYPNYSQHWHDGALRKRFPPQRSSTSGKIYILQTPVGRNRETVYLNPGRRNYSYVGIQRPINTGYQHGNNYVGVPRYDVHYSNWMGLRYGELGTIFYFLF